MAVSLGRLEVETADHVVLRYDLAGGGNRGFAALVDFILATFIFIGAFFMFTTAANAVGFQSASPYFGIATLLTFAVAWSYSRWRGRRSVGILSAVLKLAGLAALALCLVEPLLTGSRPQPGAPLLRQSRSFQYAADRRQKITVSISRNSSTQTPTRTRAFCAGSAIHCR